MHTFSNALSLDNIDEIVESYTLSAEQIGDSIANMRGIHLLNALKRDLVGTGPYSKVTLFEAANRIMSDLVILHGVRWLLKQNVFDFDTYVVEYGNQDKNGYDIRAKSDAQCLIGEAFNVAKSFFQSKKWKMLRKLRKASGIVDFKIIMINKDAVQMSYVPKLQENEFLVLVDIQSSTARIINGPRLVDGNRTQK